EVRYRVKSWRRLEACVEDARAAVQAVGARRTILLGISMGGAVAISAADERSVERVLGLAPWIPDRLSLEPLQGKRLDVFHGSLDRWVPGIPGVSPACRGMGAAGRGSACGALKPAALELGGVGDLHVPDEPEPLERADHPPRDVDLAAAEAVPRGSGEGVVVVVPAL